MVSKSESRTNSPTVGIVDTNSSNIRSVIYACKKYFPNIKILKSYNDNQFLDGLIVPGVGSFQYVLDQLNKKKLDKLIIEFLEKDKPSLFICVGMQILFSRSYEFGLHNGLNIFNGDVKKIPRLFNNRERNVPFIGWNTIEQKKENQLFKGITKKEFFYFTHSFYVSPEKKDIIHSISDHEGFTYCSSIQYKNLVAVQFHPEKSSEQGLKVYENFKIKCENS